MPSNNSVNNSLASLKVNNSGICTNTSQPAFIARLSSDVLNVTGDSTLYTIIFDGVIQDNASSYNNSTGEFTAPVNGFYTVSTTIAFGPITTTVAQGYIVFINSNPTDVGYYLNINPSNLRLGPGNQLASTTMSSTIYLLEGAVITCKILVSGEGSDGVGIFGTATDYLSYFSAALLC